MVSSILVAVALMWMFYFCAFLVMGFFEFDRYDFIDRVMEAIYWAGKPTLFMGTICTLAMVFAGAACYFVPSASSSPVSDSCKEEIRK